MKVDVFARDDVPARPCLRTSTDVCDDFAVLVSSLVAPCAMATVFLFKRVQIDDFLGDDAFLHFGVRRFDDAEFVRARIESQVAG